MEVYLADANPRRSNLRGFAIGQLSVLCSYHYYRTVNFDTMIAQNFTVTPNIFADSGAFSAATQGAHIDIHIYCQWLLKWRHLFSVYCNLDVIGDPIGSARNQEIMESYGLTPLPVFHAGSDIKHFKVLCDRYEYIALGGLVPYLRFANKVMPLLAACFKITGDRVRLHGLGVTNWKILTSFRWHTVDSSAWGQGFRYGNVPLFIEREKRFVDLPLGNRQQAYKYAYDLHALGIDPEQVANRAKNTRKINAYVAAASYKAAERYLTKLYDRPARIYLAETPESLKGTLGGLT